MVMTAYEDFVTAVRRTYRGTEWFTVKVEKSQELSLDFYLFIYLYF